MARVRLRDGREFRLLDPMNDLTFSEVMDLERFVGQGIEDWSATTTSALMMWRSAQVAGVDLSWEEIGALKPKDLQRLADTDDGDPDADPLAPAAGLSHPPPNGVDPAALGSVPSNSAISQSGSG